MPIIVGASVAGVSAIASIVRGVQQKNQADKMERNNIRPLYKISDQIYNNVGLAENRAQGGYDQETLNYLSNQQERGLQSSMSAILQGGGSVNAIGGIYDNFLQGSKAVAMEDEKIHMANIAQLMSNRETLAEEQARAWTINDYSPYKDKQLAIAALRSDANQSISSGINTFGQAGMSLATAGMAKGAPKSDKGFGKLDKIDFGKIEPIKTELPELGGYQPMNNKVKI